MPEMVMAEETSHPHPDRFLRHGRRLQLRHHHPRCIRARKTVQQRCRRRHLHHLRSCPVPRRRSLPVDSAFERVWPTTGPDREHAVIVCV